jgi:hypothetical protein
MFLKTGTSWIIFNIKMKPIYIKNAVSNVVIGGKKLAINRTLPMPVDKTESIPHGNVVADGKKPLSQFITDIKYPKIIVSII